MAESFGYDFLEISAVTGYQVLDAYFHLARLILKQKQQEELENQQRVESDETESGGIILTTGRNRFMKK